MAPPQRLMKSRANSLIESILLKFGMKPNFIDREFANICRTKRKPGSVISMFSGPPLPCTIVRTIDASATKDVTRSTGCGIAGSKLISSGEVASLFMSVSQMSRAIVKKLLRLPL